MRFTPEEESEIGRGDRGTEVYTSVGILVLAAISFAKAVYHHEWESFVLGLIFGALAFYNLIQVLNKLEREHRALEKQKLDR